MIYQTNNSPRASVLSFICMHILLCEDQCYRGNLCNSQMTEFITINKHSRRVLGFERLDSGFNYLLVGIHIDGMALSPVVSVERQTIRGYYASFLCYFITVAIAYLILWSCVTYVAEVYL